MSHSFNRWRYPWSKSWAYYVFKKHHTQLNQVLWAHHSASRRAATLAHSIGLNQPTKKAFPAAIVDPARQSAPLEEWLSYYKDFDNWTRLSGALSLASYFESYIKKMVRLALSSDPGSILGRSQAIDGALFLKGGRFPVDIDGYVAEITKGTWSSRLASFERYFGSAPPALAESLSELDQLRILRNGVGHRFGRDIEHDDYAPLAGLEEPQRLSRERLIKWLGTVDKVVNHVDAHLRQNHIGAYEVLEAYPHVTADRFTSRWEDRRLADHFPTVRGPALSNDYCRNAIRYFNALK